MSGEPTDLLSGDRGACSSSRWSLEMLVSKESREAPESSLEMSTGESRESRDPFNDEYLDEWELDIRWCLRHFARRLLNQTCRKHGGNKTQQNDAMSQKAGIITTKQGKSYDVRTFIREKGKWRQDRSDSAFPNATCSCSQISFRLVMLGS